MSASHTCTFEAEHPDNATPEGLVDGEPVTEACDRPASVEVVVKEEQLGDLATERLCDGHATRLRVEIATGELLGLVIVSERPLQ